MTNATFTPEHLERWNSADPAFGCTGNYSGADLSPFYVAPISNGRDTEDSVTLSNWRVIGGALEKLAKHEESGVHNFGHWAVGWYELWLIHESDTAALQCADQWAAALDSYPVADESDLGEIEFEAESEAWENWGRSEWRDIVEKELQLCAPEGADQYWADEIIDAHPDSDAALDWLWRDVAGGECYHDSSGASFNFRGTERSLTATYLGEAFDLPLLAPDQQWRAEPYPWAGAEP
jgi:hypothetical protein